MVVNIGNQFSKNYIGAYDLAQDSFILKHFDQDSTAFYVNTVVLSKNEEIYSIGTKGRRAVNGNPLDFQSEILVQHFDENLNRLSKVLIGNTFSSLNIKAIINHKNEIVISALEGDRSNGDRWLRILRPVLIGLDSEFNIEWKQNIGEHVVDEDQTNYTLINSLINTHDNNGYILVGQFPRGPFTNDFYDGYIVKVDSEGNELWTILTEDAFDEAYLSLNDVIATSDGHYMAIGTRNDQNGDLDSITSRVQTVMIKFDDDGNIVERTSAVETEPVQEKLINIAPNPAAHRLTISSLSSDRLSFVLTDNSGQQVVGDTPLSVMGSYELDVSDFASGVYHLVLRSKDGIVVGTKKVVIH